MANFYTLDIRLSATNDEAQTKIGRCPQRKCDCIGKSVYDSRGLRRDACFRGALRLGPHLHRRFVGGFRRSGVWGLGPGRPVWNPLHAREATWYDRSLTMLRPPSVPAETTCLVCTLSLFRLYLHV